MKDLLIIKKTDLELLISEVSPLLRIKSSDSFLKSKIKEFIPKVIQLETRLKNEKLITDVLFFYVMETQYSNLKYPFIRKELGDYSYEINCSLLGNEVHYLVNSKKLIK